MLILAPFLAVGKNKPKVVLQKCDSIVPLIRWPDCIMGGLRGLQITLFFDDVLGKKKYPMNSGTNYVPWSIPIANFIAYNFQEILV